MPDEVGTRDTTRGNVLLPRELLDAPGMTLTAVRVAGELGQSARTSGLYWRTNEALADRLGLKARAVQLALELLERLGWIKRGLARVWGKVRRVIALRWLRTLPPKDRPAKRSEGPRPLLDMIDGGAISCAPGAQSHAPPIEEQREGILEREETLTLSSGPPEIRTPNAEPPPEAEAVAPDPEPLPIALALPDAVARPPEPSPAADVAGLLARLNGPLAMFRIAAYWELADAGRLPAEWADREPPGPRMEPPAPPRAKAPPRPAPTPARVPTPRELAVAAIRAVPAEDGVDLVAKIEHAAESLAALLDDRGSLGWHRKKLRELACGYGKADHFARAIAKAFEGPADRRGPLFNHWLGEFSGARKDPAPGLRPSIPGAGLKALSPPRHQFTTIG